MRLANLDGRATIVVDGGGVDVAAASGGRFGPDAGASGHIAKGEFDQLEFLERIDRLMR